MKTSDIKKLYDELNPPAGMEWGGMNGWFDRLHPFDVFMARGKDVADFMRGKDADFRKEFPALWDLLYRVFP